MVSPIDMKRVLNNIVGNGGAEPSGEEARGFEYLFQRNFVEFSSPKGPLYVALRKGKSVLCLPCLLLEKVEVEFNTKSEFLSHVKVAHSHLHDLILKDASSLASQ